MSVCACVGEPGCKQTRSTKRPSVQGPRAPSRGGEGEGWGQGRGVMASQPVSVSQVQRHHHWHYV